MHVGRIMEVPSGIQSWQWPTMQGTGTGWWCRARLDGCGVRGRHGHVHRAQFFVEVSVSCPIMSTGAVKKFGHAFLVSPRDAGADGIHLRDRR